MAKRNMEQIAEKVHNGCHIPKEYQLILGDINRLHELIHEGCEGELKAISIVYDYGFAMGCRATRKGRTKVI